VSSGKTGGVRATLDAWRECGADRLDPLRFHFIEAMARRAAGHSGEARRVLDDRLSGLLETYAGDLERAASSSAAQDGSVVPGGRPLRGALGALTDYVASHALVNDAGAAAAKPRPCSYPDLELLDYFREVWSKLSTTSQLQQSLKQVPGNAGPLNSSSLVHRALSLMHELSPGYLQQFLAYADALSWMEQINGGDASAAKDAPRAASARKGTRGKLR
jgi:hypothetical protein